MAMQMQEWSKHTGKVYRVIFAVGITVVQGYIACIAG